MDDYDWEAEYWGVMASDLQAKADDEAVEKFLGSAQRRKIGVMLTREEIKGFLFGPCRRCTKRPMQYEAHRLERLDTRDYFSRGNCVPMCKECGE